MGTFLTSLAVCSKGVRDLLTTGAKVLIKWNLSRAASFLSPLSFSRDALDDLTSTYAPFTNTSPPLWVEDEKQPEEGHIRVLISI